MKTQSIPVRALIGLIRFYRRRISPAKPPACRFTPTCSAYAIEAIEVYGAVWGAWMAVSRIARCNPFHKGGYDPVPRPDRWQGSDTPSRQIHGGSASQ